MSSDRTFSPIGLAILGAGIYAKEAHIPALAAIRAESRTPFELVATYSRSHKSSSELSTFASSLLNLSPAPAVYSDDSSNGSDLDALLKRTDIHAVIILLPIPVQPAIVLKCFEAGKHVLSEKPVAPSVAEGLTLISSAEKYTTGKTALIWRIAENYECELITILARQLIEKKKIGKVTGFSLEAFNDLQKESKYYQTPWRTIPEYEGGFLLDGGVHSAALVRSIIPVPLENVKGGVKISGWAGLVRDYLSPEDTMNLSVFFGSGEEKDEKSLIAPSAIGTFNLTFAAATSAIGKKRSGFDIFGTEGWLEFFNNIPSGKTDGSRVGKVKVHRRNKDGGDEVEEHEVAGGRSTINEIEAFFRSIRGDASEEEKAYGDPKRTLWDVAFIEAGLNSKGNLVDLGALLSGR